MDACSAEVLGKFVFGWEFQLDGLGLIRFSSVLVCVYRCHTAHITVALLRYSFGKLVEKKSLLSLTCINETIIIEKLGALPFFMSS